MAEPKTKQTDEDVYEFINSFANTEQKRLDSYELVKIMQASTGHEPKMWGPTMIGFGVYHYQSDKSKQKGDWPLVAFSPRKAAISLYIYVGSAEHVRLLRDLGKYKMAKYCIYIKKLSDIDRSILKSMIDEAISFTHAKFGKL